MRNALALIAAAALAATAAALAGPAQAHDRWPDIPYEIGVGCQSLASLGFPIGGAVIPRLLGNLDLTKAAHRLRDLLVVAV